MDRQTALCLHTDTSVAVIGCGGVGSWAALALAKAGVGDVHVWDHDVVELSNLHRTPYRMEDVGRPKVEALATLLNFPACLHAHSRRWTNATSVHPNWVISAADNHALRLQVYEWSMRVNARHIEAGAEGDLGTVNDMPATVDNSPVLVGYEFTPQWIGPNLFAGLMAASFVLYNIQPHWTMYQKGVLR